MGYLTKDNRFHAFALMGTLTFLALEKSFMNVMWVSKIGLTIIFCVALGENQSDATSTHKKLLSSKIAEMPFDWALQRRKYNQFSLMFWDVDR